ncbi:YciI family protein (plasmid) [Tistrella mobilis]|jgi:hypothetical protein|uniref:YciI family protein n=1 Tax=Tistrella mobilis TaxID=171437 RepID=UPI00355743B1
MLYAVLCYDREDLTEAWPEDRMAGTMARLEAVQADLAAAGRLGPVARLMPTAHAKTVTKSETPTVTDGPFAETREQLLGFFIIDCADAAAAEAAAADLARANASGTGVYELRPLRLLKPGVLP